MVRKSEFRNSEFLLYLVLYLRRRRRHHDEVFGCVQYFTDGVNEWSSITFCKKCPCSTSRLSATDKETSTQL